MKLTTYQTANGNWRVLVDGAVHPLLCGFDDEQTATKAGLRHLDLLRGRNPDERVHVETSTCRLLKQVDAANLMAMRIFAEAAAIPGVTRVHDSFMYEPVTALPEQDRIELAQWRRRFGHLGSTPETASGFLELSLKTLQEVIEAAKANANRYLKIRNSGGLSYYSLTGVDWIKFEFKGCPEHLDRYLDGIPS